MEPKLIIILPLVQTDNCFMKDHGPHINFFYNFSINRFLWLSIMMLFSAFRSLFYCRSYFFFSCTIVLFSFSLVIFHRVVLVENIPEDISFLENGTSHLPLSVGLYNLLDQAIRVVEIVSPLWLLNSSDYESSFQPAARQVKPERAHRDVALQKKRLLFKICFTFCCLSVSGGSKSTNTTM